MSTPYDPMARWLVANLHKPFFNAWHVHHRRLVEVAGADEAYALLARARAELHEEGWPVRVALVNTKPPELPGSPTPPPPSFRSDWHD